VTEPTKKTVIVPEDFTPKKDESEGPFFAFVPWNDDDGRDVSQPVGYDANGQPLYAPCGIRLRGW
jgi:hypothetical protein